MNPTIITRIQFRRVERPSGGTGSLSVPKSQPTNKMSEPKSNSTAIAGSSSHCLLGVALRVLNEAYAADPAAMHAMVNLRVPCNDALADHPTIQVGANQFSDALRFDVGIVGILNGIFEAATGERLAVSISDDGEGIVVGFVPYTPNA